MRKKNIQTRQTETSDTIMAARYTALGIVYHLLHNERMEIRKAIVLCIKCTIIYTIIDNVHIIQIVMYDNYKLC